MSTQPEKILVVDDTAHIRSLFAQMLTAQGYEVQVAANGASALEAVKTNPPDLILLDIMMPEMDGYEVCRCLKADPSTRDIPVIFISALGEMDDKVEAFAVGGVDYVTKPFQPKEIQARVRTHLALRALQKRLQATSEALAVQLEEVRARNEELDALARSMAQELKSPLTAIIGFADMLDKLYHTLPEEQVRESLRTIAANGRKMERIIDELLLLAGLRRVEKVDIKPLDMAAVVKAAVRRLADLIEERQVRILLPDTWPTVMGYRPWVEEVWYNCLRSAIESSEQEAMIALGSTPEGNDSVRFWVRVQGPGTFIPGPADHPDAERGLMTVRRIMEKLGLKASVESTADQGVLYSFTLRRA
ncbi:MAG: response regulator [Anaerolineae bacterium]|nr:response regulator [Anaerolineae bacterium]